MGCFKGSIGSLLVLAILAQTHVATSQVCSGTSSITLSQNVSRSLGSPSYPSNYPNNLDCTWIISTTPNSSVEITFTNFSTEQNFDYLEIRDGPFSYSRQIASYSGTHSTFSFTSSGTTLRIRFKTDGSVTRRGFSAWYRRVTALPYMCSGTSNLSPSQNVSSSLRSPGYPSNYPNYLDCTWIISTTPGSSVEITFSYFSTDFSDYLEIHDGPYSYSRRVARYSGSRSAFSFTSSGATLRIRFTSNGSGTGRGFSAWYRRVAALPNMCSGTSYLAPSQNVSSSLRSPGYPSNYPNYLDCTWIISTTPKRRVEITFFNFSTDSFDYLEIRDGRFSYSRLLARYSGTRSTFNFTSSGPTLRLRFTSNGSGIRRGFFAWYRRVAGLPYMCSGTSYLAPSQNMSTSLRSPGYPSNYINNLDCTWIISTTTGSNIKITFFNFSTDSFDYLEIRDGPYSYSRQLARYSGTRSTFSFTSSGTTLHIRFRSGISATGRGFSAWYRRVAALPYMCSGTSYLSPSQNVSKSLRSPGYPSNYANYLDCTWIISTTQGSSVEITFSYFSTDIFDYLEIRDGSYSYSRQLARYSGTRSTFSFTSSGTTLRIRFTSNGSGTRGGFSARYRRIVTVVPTTRPVLPYMCSGTSYLSPSQYGSRSLRSPGYPSNYPNNLDCTWIISTTPGNSVEITFSYFSTDSFDYLEIRDGRYSYNRQLAHYSGIRSTFSFTSSGTTLRIRFTSNGSGTRGGFSARYRRVVTVVPTTRPVLPYTCSGTSYLYPAQYSRSFRSPGYPSNYPNNLDCTWIISTTSGSRVEITFSSFSTERIHDYLEIRDGRSSYSRLLASYSGSRSTFSFTSSGTTLRISFKSDGSVTRGGFSARYRRIITTVIPTTKPYMCSGTSYLSPSQYVSRSLRSPGYPSNYPNNLDCTWIISTTPGSSVEIRFSYFSTDSFDYLEIRDGRYSYSRLLARYSGTRSTFRFTSSGTTLRIRFTSNGSGTKRGFFAQYRRIVTVVPTTEHFNILPYSAANRGDEVVRGVSGQIQAQSTHAWTIIVPSSHKVRLQIEFLDLNTCSGSCNEYNSCGSVSVYEGPSSHRKALGVYCGKHVPAPIYAEGNIMRVQLKSGNLNRPFRSSVVLQASYKSVMLTPKEQNLVIVMSCAGVIFFVILILTCCYCKRKERRMRQQRSASGQEPMPVLFPLRTAGLESRSQEGHLSAQAHANVGISNLAETGSEECEGPIVAPAFVEPQVDFPTEPPPPYSAKTEQETINL